MTPDQFIADAIAEAVALETAALRAKERGLLSCILEMNDETAALRQQLADEAKDSKIICDSYADENQRFHDEILSLRQQIENCEKLRQSALDDYQVELDAFYRNLNAQEKS